MKRAKVEYTGAYITAMVKALGDGDEEHAKRVLTALDGLGYRLIRTIEAVQQENSERR